MPKKMRDADPTMAPDGLSSKCKSPLDPPPVGVTENVSKTVVLRLRTFMVCSATAFKTRAVLGFTPAPPN